MADLNHLLEEANDNFNEESENDDAQNVQEPDLGGIVNDNVIYEDGFIRSNSENPLMNKGDMGDENNELKSSQAQSQDVDEENIADRVADEDLDYTQLKHLWIAEMSCPELFPFDAEIFEAHKNLVNEQEDQVEELTNSAAASHSKYDANVGHRASTRQKYGKDQVDPNLTSLVASIHRMEADRVRFLLADLSRTRLKKIEAHPLYMRNMVDRMSSHEVKYLVAFGELVEEHLRRTVLNHMPRDSLKKLDEPEMIDHPDLDEYVFCQVIENVLIEHDSILQNVEDEEDDDENYEIGGPQEYEAGSSLIARYGLVKDYIMEGKIQLLL